MQKILVTILSVFIFAAAMPALADDNAQSAEFFETLPDVPKMKGMEERDDLTFIFDKPEGRIIETLAHLEGLSAEEIRTYYSDALPQLGWMKNNSDEFFREREKLSLQFEEEFLKITISPR